MVPEEDCRLREGRRQKQAKPGWCGEDNAREEAVTPQIRLFPAQISPPNLLTIIMCPQTTGI
jgi:hypothetical protein